MSRFYGAIGYSTTVETRPGIYEETYVEKNYKGDVTQYRPRWDNNGQVNNDLNINNEISIIADQFASSNFSTMRYVIWNGQAFNINSATIDTERHRIVLSIGGVFNGKLVGED